MAASCPGSAMPAPPPPAAPAPHAALRSAPGGVAGRRERGSGSAALPRGRRQCRPAAPGKGAEARSSVPAEGEQGRQETPRQSGDGVFIPSCLRPPGLRRRAAPDPTLRDRKSVV